MMQKIKMMALIVDHDGADIDDGNDVDNDDDDGCYLLEYN